MSLELLCPVRISFELHLQNMWRHKAPSKHTDVGKTIQKPVSESDIELTIEITTAQMHDAHAAALAKEF